MCRAGQSRVEILRVSWTDKRSNDWVLQKAETKLHLLQAIKKRKLYFYGHALRKEGSCTEKEIIEGTTPGQPKTQMKTKDQLAGEHHGVDWAKRTLSAEVWRI